MKHVMEKEQSYELLMPEYDPALWRDEFMRKLFKELDLPENERFTLDTSTESSTSRLLDRGVSKNFTASSFKFSVLSGRTDQYDELLESIKRSSLYFMFSRVLNRLRIMEKISLDWGEIELNSLPHMIFSWSIDAFFNRCMLPDSLYLDILQLNHSEESLDWAKFSSDILEIIRYYKFFYSETFLNKGHKAMLTIVWNQQLLLKIGEKLDKTLEISKNDFDHIAQTSRKVADACWVQHRQTQVKDCRRRAMEATVLLPIQWRYIRDYYATMTEMQMLKDNMIVEKLRTQITELKQQMIDDQQSTSQAILVYSLLIEVIIAIEY